MTDFIPMIYYYFSQDATVSKYKAPNSIFFEGQSAAVFSNIYADMGKNYNDNISQFFKDYLSVKNVFIVGDSDYISYKKAFRNWLENDVTFI